MSGRLLVVSIGIYRLGKLFWRHLEDANFQVLAGDDGVVLHAMQVSADGLVLRCASSMV